MSGEFVLEDQSEAIAALMRPSTYGDGAGPVERIDTHGAAVFLVGDRVFKMKRAVRFPYMDFSTRALRAGMAAAEIRVNRGFAPAIYLGVAPLLRSSAGEWRMGAPVEPQRIVEYPDAVEWLVAMRRFDGDLLLSKLADTGRLGIDVVTRLAARLAVIHADAPRSDAHAGAERYRHAVATDVEQMRARGEGLDVGATEALSRAMPAALAPHEALIEARRLGGAVRRVHGDLHLRNVCLIDGEPTPFDAIEFSESIANIDILYDLAFLLMDLCHRGLVAHANGALNHYLWRADEPATIGAGNLDALALLPLFIARRGAIRAYVDAAAAEIKQGAERAAALDAARAYQRTALEALRPAAPRVVAVGGLSGTGKTTLAMALAPLLDAIPGAAVLRSDVIRKRVAGVALDSPMPAGSYSPAASAVIYAELSKQAGQVLRAGRTPILDAVFSRPEERAAAEAVARAAGVPFLGLWLQADIDTSVARVTARKGDASDATADIVKRQAEYALGEIGWSRIDASGPLAATVAAARNQLGL